MVENGKENCKNDESNKTEFIKPFEFIEPKHTALTMARLVCFYFQLFHLN